MSPTITEWLNNEGRKACRDARDWLKTLPADATMSDAWAQCRRSDWMQWAAIHSPFLETDERWRLAGCAIIRRTPLHDGRTVWDLLTDERSRNAVEVAERFARGEASSEELASAASDAYAAYAASDAYAAAAYAAYAASASYASYASAWAVRAAVYAASAAASAVLREFIPDPWATQTAGPGKEEG